MTINGRFVVLLIVLAFVSYYSYVYDSVRYSYRNRND